MPTRLFVCTPTQAGSRSLTASASTATPTWRRRGRRRVRRGRTTRSARSSTRCSPTSSVAGRLPAVRRTKSSPRCASSWRSEGFRDERAVAGLARSIDGHGAGLPARPRPVLRTASGWSARSPSPPSGPRCAAAWTGIDDARPRRSGGTELVIVDYKTGRRPLTSDGCASSLAMALYVLGARRVLHKPCTRVELHHLPTNTVAAADHDRRVARPPPAPGRVDRRRRRRGRGSAGAKGLTPAEADEAFPPEPSALCGWCDFARICPQGRRSPHPATPGPASTTPPADPGRGRRLIVGHASAMCAGCQR